MQQHSAFDTEQHFIEFCKAIESQQKEVLPCDFDWEEYISIENEFKKSNFDPSNPDEEIFDYFSSKYMYDIFTKKDIEEFVSIETFNWINYTCEYLSSMHITKTTSTKSGNTSDNENAENFLFKNAQATHYGLLYKRKGRLYGINGFVNLSDHLLNNHCKILLNYPRRTKTAYHIKNFINKEKYSYLTNGDFHSRDKELSPAEFYLYERMTHINSIAVLTNKLCYLTSSVYFEPIYSEARFNPSSRHNAKYLKPVHKLIDIIANSPLSHSKALILNKIFKYQIDNNINGIDAKNYFTYDEEKQIQDAPVPQDDLNEPKLSVSLQKGGSPSIILKEPLEFKETFSMNTPPRKFDEKKQGTTRLLNFSKNEEYKLYFSCAILNKVLDAVAKIVEHKTEYLFYKYISEAIFIGAASFDTIINKIKTCNNAYISEMIENSNNLKGFSTSDLLILEDIAEQHRNSITTTEAVDAINEYVHEYLIFNHNKDYSFLPSWVKSNEHIGSIEQNRTHISPSKEASDIIRNSRNL